MRPHSFFAIVFLAIGPLVVTSACVAEPEVEPTTQRMVAANTCPEAKDRAALLALQQPETCIFNDDCPPGVACVCPTSAACAPTERICDAPASPACTDDETCPIGSRCDQAALRCAFECLATEDPEFGCAAGLICDCEGRCVPPLIPEYPAPPPAVHIAIEPASLTVSTANWVPRHFTLVLESDALPTEPPVIQVSAGPATQVSCSHTPDVFAHSCAPLTDWSFHQVGTRYRAARRIWVAPHPDAVTATTWSFDVATVASNTPHQSATIGLDTVTEPALPAEFAGTLTMHGSNGSAEMTIPVTAWAFEEAIVFFDPQRLLTSAGRLVVSTDPTELQLFYWVTDPHQEPGDSYSGADVTLREDTLTLNANHAQGSIDILFDTSFGGQTWSFNLERIGDVVPSPCPCDEGYSCDRRLQLCMPGGEWDVVDLATPYLEVGYPQTFVDALLAQIKTNRLFHSLSIADHPIWTSTGAKLANWIFRELGWDQADSAPPNPEDAEQVVLCYNPITHDGFGIGSDVLPVSGDLACDNGDAQRGVELATYRDRDGTLGAADMLRACVEELAAPVPETIAGQMQASDAKAHLERATCISKLHYYYAVDWARRTDRRQYLGRLVQQWIQLHSFVALQGVQERHLADVLGDDPELDPTDASAIGSTPSWETLLDLSAQGWRTALDYWTIAPLGDRTIAQLRKPDWRGDDAGAHDVQSGGITVTTMEGASATLDLVEGYLRSVHPELYADCPPSGIPETAAATLARAGDVVRHAMLAATYADHVFDVATAGSCSRDDDCGDGGACTADVCTGGGVGTPDFDWRGRYLAARDEYQAKLATVGSLMTDISACRNPLGLPDDYTPLYFRERVDVAERFFANSDYILDEWAVPAQTASAELVESARSRWLSIRNGAIQQQLAGTDRERRLNELRSHYGRSLIAMCGMVEAEPQSVLGMFTSPTSTITSHNCYLTRASACDITVADLNTAITQDAVRYQLCLYDAVSAYVDLSPSTYGGVNMAAAAAGFETATVSSGLVSSGGTSFDGKLLYVRPTGIALVPQNVRAAAELSCQLTLGGADYLPAAIDINPDLNSNAECYRGTLGESQLALFASNAAMKAAHGRYQASRNHFEAQLEYCVDKQARYDENHSLRDEHAASIAALQEETLELNRILDESGWVAQLTSNPVGFSFDALSGVVLGGGSPFHTLDARTSLRDLETRMRAEQLAFDNLMSKRAEDDKIIDCFHQVALYKEGINTALLEFRVAADEFEVARLRVANQHAQFSQTVAEGRAAVEREVREVGPDFGHHQWLDEDVDKFHRQFQRAKRFAYLAARAAEYDFQRSLPERADAIIARRPEDLNRLLDDLRGYQAAPVIGDGQPAEFARVLSLRDDVLELTDIVIGEVGASTTISAEQRLQSRLLHDSAHVYAANGTYLGRGFRFTLDENDFLPTHCAERGWYLSADVSGLGLTGVGTPLVVFKSNTGYSQSCNAEPLSHVYQVGAVRMSVNPFLSEIDSGPTIVEERFSSGTINASINDDDGVFGGPGELGSTRAFAGRGLFGEYIVVFPWFDAEQGFDIDLHRLRDVKLRFDYLYGENAPSP